VKGSINRSGRRPPDPIVHHVLNVAVSRRSSSCEKVTYCDDAPRCVRLPPPAVAATSPAGEPHGAEDGRARAGVGVMSGTGRESVDDSAADPYGGTDADREGAGADAVAAGTNRVVRSRSAAGSAVGVGSSWTGSMCMTGSLVGATRGSTW
jgi:hypothetical protein